MSLWKSYLALSPRTRAGVGIGVLLWGTAGLYLSDAAGDRIGITPTEADKKELDRLTPKIHIVDHEEKSP